MVSEMLGVEIYRLPLLWLIQQLVLLYTSRDTFFANIHI